MHILQVSGNLLRGSGKKEGFKKGRLRDTAENPWQSRPEIANPRAAHQALKQQEMSRVARLCSMHTPCLIQTLWLWFWNLLHTTTGTTSSLLTVKEHPWAEFMPLICSS